MVNGEEGSKVLPGSDCFGGKTNLALMATDDRWKCDKNQLKAAMNNKECLREK